MQLVLEKDVFLPICLINCLFGWLSFYFVFVFFRNENSLFGLLICLYFTLKKIKTC